MPAGLSWPKYLTFMTSAFLSMLAGAQIVHSIYEPLKDLPEYIEREKVKLRAQQLESSDNETS